MEFSAEILAALFLAACIAGWVDAIAGGGGMIALPALLLAGAPPAAALATNKLQGSFGTFTSALYFVRKGVVRLSDEWTALLAICIGSVVGGWLLTQIEAGALTLLIPVLLILIGVYFLFFARDLDEVREPRIGEKQFNTTVAPGLGFYDGFFGPGTGSFMSTSLVLLRGMPVRDATAHAKLYNFASNIAALIYFVFFGEILWVLGATMIAGQILGATLGARTAFRGGAKIIRPVTILVCFAMSAKALYDVI